MAFLLKRRDGRDTAKKKPGTVPFKTGRMVSLPFLFFLLLAVCVFSFFTFSPLIRPNSSRFLRSTAYLWYDSLDGLSRGLSLHWTRQVDRRTCPRTILASSPSVRVRTATDVQRTVR